MPEYDKLNEAQRKAVTWDGGPLLVLAGPGSGKTFTIVKRISYLLEQGTPPEQILVITFTKEAAKSMQRRFQASVQGFRPVNFGTFHSVFYHILKESHSIQTQKILSTSEKRKLMIPILKKRNIADNNSLFEDAGTLLEAISYYKNTCDRETSFAKVPSVWLKDFPEIYREYEAAVRREKALDFDDMLFACRRILQENPALRRQWQRRFTYILIDEFQDINPVQYEIIRLLSASPHNIFAVGDDDQSIYGFRGSRPECLKRFQEEFKAQQILLDVNYRSRRKIIETSLKVMEESKNRFPKQIRSGRSEAEEGEVKLLAFTGKEQEHAYLLGRLEQFKKMAENAPERAETAAVLFRTNSAMQSFAAELRRRNIPFRMKEQAKSIYEHFIVKDIMAYLLLAEGKEKREYLLRILNKPERRLSREMTAEEESHSVEMKQLRGHLSGMKNMSLPLAVTYLLKAVGYERYLRKLSYGKPEQWNEWQEILEWMKGDAKNYGNAGEWLGAQEFYREKMEQEGQRERSEEEGNRELLHLMTVHASKGLEFDTVLIPDCNEGVFPYGAMPDEESVEEERRILYVAMTRAKTSLELLYLTGTEKSPRLPSRFLNSLLYSSSSTTSSNSTLSRYSSKASATFSYSSSSSMKSSTGSSLGSSGFSL